MEDFVLVAASLKLGYAALAVLLMLGFTRWLDRRAKVDFAQMLRTILTKPEAAAIYFGARIIAVGLLIGMVVG